MLSKSFRSIDKSQHHNNSATVSQTWRGGWSKHRPCTTRWPCRVLRRGSCLDTTASAIHVESLIEKYKVYYHLTRGDAALIRHHPTIFRTALATAHSDASLLQVRSSATQRVPKISCIRPGLSVMSRKSAGDGRQIYRNEDRI